MTVAAPQRNVVTGRGLFVALMAEIRRRQKEERPKRGTCWMEVLCPCNSMLVGHPTDLVQDGVYKSGEMKGQPKMVGRRNPFLSETEKTADGKKWLPLIAHHQRFRADIYVRYQERIQQAQKVAGVAADYQSGKPVWDWNPIIRGGERMPFNYKVLRGADGKEIEIPDSQKQIYLFVYPYWNPRDENGQIRLNEDGSKMVFPGAFSKYVRLDTKEEIDYSLIAPYMPDKSEYRERRAEEIGIGIDDVYNPMTVSIQNVISMSVVGRHFELKERSFKHIDQAEFDRLEWLVSQIDDGEPMTEAEEQAMRMVYGVDIPITVKK